MTFNTAIVNRLAFGSIKTVRLFGDSAEKPPKPYVVVKPIASGDRKLYQIIVHAELGMQDFLEMYILRELPVLLKEPLLADGKVIKARSTGAWLGPYVDEGDNSLVMTRDFYIPVVI